MRYQLLGYAIALATAVANALPTQQWCDNQGICFLVNVPSNGKDLFLQISGPSSMSWIGLGQGGMMKDSNMFLIYSNSAGSNVTLSYRLGTGHVPPQLSTDPQLTLLDGSNITSDKMVANIKCSNCQSWSGGTMDFMSGSTNWIYGSKSGPAIKSDADTAPILIHDHYGTFQFDLTKATGGDGTINPFNILNGSLPNSSGGNGTAITEDPTVTVAAIAHGWMAAATFVLILPTGSIAMRILPFKHVLWFHIGIQMIGCLAALAVLWTGVYIAVKEDALIYAHPILGIVVIGGLCFQPFLGVGHHILYKRRGGPNILTLPHIWWGRILITVGIINGGLGLQIMPESVTIMIAYGVVASVFWCTWMGLNILSYVRSKNRAQMPMTKETIPSANTNKSHEATPHQY